MEKSLIDIEFENITENLKVIRERVSKAALASGRGEDEVKLMAVTKTIEPARINYAISQGVDLIGENRVQEFQSKIDELDMTACKAHLIGHLQSNKAKKIVGEVDVIQSVDTVSIAKEIAKHVQRSACPFQKRKLVPRRRVLSIKVLSWRTLCAICFYGII